jgi:hypothetical protein
MPNILPRRRGSLRAQVGCSQALARYIIAAGLIKSPAGGPKYHLQCRRRRDLRLPPDV